MKHAKMMNKLRNKDKNMSNSVELIGGIISILKKTIFFTATVFGLLSTSTPTTKSSIDNIIPKSSQKTAIENTDKIIGVLNQSNNITVSTTSNFEFNVPENTDKIKQVAKKLNQLNITAPSYSILKIPNKKTTASNNEGLGSFLQNLGFKKQISINTKGSDESVVNIRCENKKGNSLKIITGSGVIINSSGLILTAAHVAAPMYSEQSGYICHAAINNPATGKYPLKIIFIDPEWVNKYYSVFDKTHSETGEDDVALLQIDIADVSDSDITKLNATAYSTISVTPMSLGSSITIKSYPSDIYGKFGVFSVLPRKSEQVSVEGLFNFDKTATSPFDLIETGPSSLGQSGASGGGIFNDQGQLVGIISNMVSSNILLKNKIRALSIKYIDNETKKGLNRSIFEYLRY